MYISLEQIKISLDNLERIHPFFGIVFLVCKLGQLPIGKTTVFPINQREKDFLDAHYKPLRSSQYYYRVFRPSDKSKRWVASKYASSTLQSTRTRGEFEDAFMHEKGTDIWGWSRDYLKQLSSHLRRRREQSGFPRVPAFDLAVWLFRERDWLPGTTAAAIVEHFFDTFAITPEERQRIFDDNNSALVNVRSLFQNNRVSWEELRTITKSPPDALPDEGGTLAYLRVQGVGPSKEFVFDPAERLNLVVGDNGLGKTFLLECAWWALSGHWAGLPAFPRDDATVREAQITLRISSQNGGVEEKKISYDMEAQEWPTPRKRPTIPGLLIYARVDGSFAVWDPAKNYWSSRPADETSSAGLLVFTKDQVWDGREERVGEKVRVASNGLLRDWVAWQSNPDRYPFDTFLRVLRRLSPPDMGSLVPGESVRLPYDVREIPTLRHPYGDVPIVHASAGIQRVLALAYLLVWAWEEHQAQSRLIRRPPQRRMVVMVDEIEAHLHPRWQRVILPALLDTRAELDRDLQIQFLIATHSPLVMASAEPLFDERRDRLFHLDLIERGSQSGQVKLVTLPFIRHGSIDSWLVSEVFELRHARSIEADQVIEDAKALQSQAEPDREGVRDVTERLKRLLSADDEFWPRWKFFAEQRGVQV